MSSISAKRLDRATGKAPVQPKPTKGGELSLRKSTGDSAIPWVNKLVASLLKNPEKIRLKLERSGRTIALGEYVLLNAVMMIIFYLLFNKIMAYGALRSLLFGAACGIYLPHFIVSRMGNNRVNKFLKYFPESIDTMCRGLRSGLPISESMSAVAREMPDPIGLEFSRITDAVRLGKTMEQAMWDVSRRIDAPEFRFMIIAMAIQRETGGNLAETLGNLADLLRKRRQLRLKIRALSSEARASAMIIGSLPFVMFMILFLVNRDYIMQMVNTPKGNTMLYIAGGLMTMGHGIMAKMIPCPMVSTTLWVYGIVGAVVVWILWKVLLETNPLEARLRAVSQRRRELTQEAQKRPGRRARAKAKDNKKQISLMKRVVAALKMQKKNDGASELRLNLIRAGYRSRDAVAIFLFSKVALAGGGSAFFFFLMFAGGSYKSKPAVALLSVAGIALFGWLLPNILVKNQAVKRQTVLKKAMPDALDLLVICAEAGLSLDAGMDRVGKEIGQTYPILGEEFGLTSVELGLLPERTKALQNLADRVDLQSVISLVNTLIQTERYGTPLAQALRVLASEMREERMMKAEEKAARLPAVMTVPMILFILPTLFIIIIGPAAIKVMSTMAKQ
jgi:Flp pilus assembly protein TadB